MTYLHHFAEYLHSVAWSSVDGVLSVSSTQSFAFGGLLCIDCHHVRDRGETMEKTKDKMR
jgi:hypothetical protein